MTVAPAAPNSGQPEPVEDGVLMFRVVVTADGEVRDADGNLISSEPVEATMDLTADQLRELGIPVPSNPQEG